MARLVFDGGSRAHELVSSAWSFDFWLLGGASWMPSGRGFLHVAVPGAPSPALSHRLPLRDLPLPACACVHSTADVQHHSPKVGQAVVSHRCPSVAHHAHGTHVPPFPAAPVPVAASPPLRLSWPPAHDEKALVDFDAGRRTPPTCHLPPGTARRFAPRASALGLGSNLGLGGGRWAV